MTTEAVSMPAAVLPVETGNTTRRLWSLAFYAALTIGAIIWIAPVYLLVSTAFKSSLDFSTNGALSLPSRIEWGNFAKAWDAGIKTYFFNSLGLTLIKVPIGVLIEAMAAFALSQMNSSAQPAHLRDLSDRPDCADPDDPGAADHRAA